MGDEHLIDGHPHGEEVAGPPRREGEAAGRGGGTSPPAGDATNRGSDAAGDQPPPLVPAGPLPAGQVDVRPAMPAEVRLVPATAVDASIIQAYRRRGSRRSLVVAVVIGVLCSGALGWLSWNQRSTAQAWRARAERRAALLQASRAEVRQLDRRVERLAGEKANLADQKEQFGELLRITPAVTAALRRCAADMARVADEALDVAIGYSLTGLTAAINSADASCGRARSLADSLESAVDDLGL